MRNDMVLLDFIEYCLMKLIINIVFLDVIFYYMKFCFKFDIIIYF